MKRCIAVLLILCLLFVSPCVLAADETSAEPETETAEETLPETEAGEEPVLPETGEDMPTGEETEEARDGAEESAESGEGSETAAEPEESGGTETDAEETAEPEEIGEETEIAETAPAETEGSGTEPEENAEPGNESEEPGNEPGEPEEEPEEPEDESGYIPGQFADVDESRWYGTEGQGVIRRVWELGLMNGMGNGCFLPEGSLRVCEAVKLAAVIRSRALEDGAEFLPTQPWYQTYVDYAEAEGILQPGELADRMGEAVTRGELAHILAGALPEADLPHINAIFAIPDVISLDTEPSGYWKDILLLYRAGVLLGDGGTHAFRPDDGINRAEAAAAAVRMALPEERQRLELLPQTGASRPLPEAALFLDDEAGLTLGYHPWAEFFTFVGEEQAEESADLCLSLDRDDSLGYPVYGEEGSRILAVYPRFTVEYLIADRDPQGMYILRLEGRGKGVEDSRGIRMGTTLRKLLAAFPEVKLDREDGDADIVWYSCTFGDPPVVYRYGVGWDGYVLSFSMALTGET